MPVRPTGRKRTVKSGQLFVVQSIKERPDILGRPLTAQPHTDEAAAEE